MKKQLIPLLLLTLLVGCGDISSSDLPSNSDSQDNTSDTIPSEDSMPSEEPSEDSNDSELPTSEEPVGTIYSDLAEIVSIGQSFVGLENERGVYTSNYYAEFRAQLLSVQTYITNQGGYTSSYKVLVANETGHVLVSVNADAYTQIKKYHSKQQVYDFKGYIGIYNNEVEVVMDTLGRPQYQDGVILNYDFKTYAKQGSPISSILTEVKALDYNTKGVAFSSDIKVYQLKYLLKMENTIALFTDGTNLIQVHSHDKINGSFSGGTVYNIYARQGLYQFKPTLEYVGHTVSEAVVDFELDPDMDITTVADITNLRYTLDSKTPLASNFQYADALINVYYFEGFANYYTKGNKQFVVFDDTAKDSYYAITNASSAKALFANNDSSVAMSENDWKYCPFNEYTGHTAADKVKIGFYFGIYSYTTDNSHLKIQVFETTITEIV